MAALVKSADALERAWTLRRTDKAAAEAMTRPAESCARAVDGKPGLHAAVPAHKAGNDKVMEQRYQGRRMMVHGK